MILKGNRISLLAVVAIVWWMTGCRPAATPAPTETPTGGAWPFSLPAEFTTTQQNAHTPTRETPASIPSFSPSPSQMTELTPADTPAPFPTSWPEGFTPTIRPTPTRGLPPTATPGPKGTCPEPTQKMPAIEKSDDPADYESMMLEYLSANGELSTFKKKLEEAAFIPNTYPPFIMTLFEEDVDNDSIKEFIVSVHDYFKSKDTNPFGAGIPIRTAIFIFGCRDGLYVTLERTILDVKEAILTPGLLTVEDLNANGIKDIAYFTIKFVDNHGGQRISMQVLEWEGSTFRKLVETLPEELYIAEAVDRIPEFRDLDGNGTMEIVMPRSIYGGWGVDCDFGPARDSLAVWMWDGEYYRFAWAEFTAPHFRFQAAYDGDYFAFIGLYDRAETMYLRAVFDMSLLPGSRSDWKKAGNCPLDEDEKQDISETSGIQAYARFRLVELFVRVGRVMEAEWHRSFLRSNYPPGAPGYIYGYLANTFWWEYVKEEDVTAACAAVKRETEKNKADAFALFGEYGLKNPGPTVDDICPFTAPPAE